MANNKPGSEQSGRAKHCEQRIKNAGLISEAIRMSKFAKLYKSRMWLKLRDAHLAANPLCVMCKEKGDITPAEVVDHIKRHHGCWMRFSDPNNLQSLCKRHHDSDKQHQEWLETLPSAVDVNGYPTDGRW